VGAPYAEVIGDPIAHSKSPLIHRFWLQKLGIDADYRAVQVHPDMLHEYLVSRRGDLGWRGCNVTAPHKQTVAPFMARLSREATRAGAVNTVVRGEAGTRSGFNTDVLAITEILRAAWPPTFPDQVAPYVQVIGAGGAAWAAVIGALDTGHGADFDFFNRTPEKALAMAQRLSLPPSFAGGLDGIGPIRKDDDRPEHQRYSHIVINASSMGMLGNDDVPIDLSRYYPDTVVVDMAYNPGGTGLIAQARRHGLLAFDGLDVLVRQAAEAFKLFFRTEPPREHDSELRELLTR
jgi:shikimate dehydrogenase